MRGLIGIPFCYIVYLAGVAADKPGQCPYVRRDQGGICVTECSTDNDCINAQKCCRNGCGMTCQLPARFEVPHAGVCPPANSAVDELCVDPPPCSVDQDCMRWEKCCFSGCSNLCVTPEKIEENKVGLCPGAVPRDLAPDWNPKSNCLSTCADDRNCTGDQKCCWDDECGGLACSEAFLACDYNGKIYLDREDIIDSNGCPSCLCLGGELACKELLSCSSEFNTVQIVIVCLVCCVIVCLIIGLVAYLVYRHSMETGATPQDNADVTPDKKNMMKQDTEAHEAGPSQPKYKW